MTKRSKRTRKTAEERAADLARAEQAAQAERLAARIRGFEAAGLAPASAALEANDNVEVIRTGDSREGQTVDFDSARRLDAFEALKESMKEKEFTGAYDAARRLERDILTRMGLTDRGGRGERVDCDTDKGRPERMVEAGRTVDKTLALVPDRQAWLLTQLICPSRDYDGWRPVRLNSKGVREFGAPQTGWRAIVAYITGEIQANAQGAAVRSACVSLADAYARLDAKPMARAG